MAWSESQGQGAVSLGELASGSPYPGESHVEFEFRVREYHSDRLLDPQREYELEAMVMRCYIGGTTLIVHRVEAGEIAESDKERIVAQIYGHEPEPDEWEVIESSEDAELGRRIA